jgi:hypothetical protein
MKKVTWKLGGNAGICVVDNRGRYTSYNFDQKDSANKWAQLKGSHVQAKITGAAKIKTFVVIVHS